MERPKKTNFKTKFLFTTLEMKGTDDSLQSKSRYIE